MRPHKEGMTLVELLLALMITSIIALAGAGVAAGVSHAQRHSDDYAQDLQAGRSGLERMQSVIRCSRLASSCSDQELVLWTQDDQDLGAINTDEVVVVRYDPQSRTVTAVQVQFPEGMAGATRTLLNGKLALSSMATVSQTLQQIGNTHYRSERVLASEVDSLVFVPDQPAPLTRTITIRADFASGKEAFPLVAAASLRSPATDCLKIVNNAYTLVEPVLPTGGSN